MTLNQIANDLSNRLIRLWLRDKDGKLPCAGASNGIGSDSRDGQRYWFHEYFHADTGAGLGAPHQTGWTGLVAKLILQQGDFGTLAKRDPFSDL
jgi:hypothetical protein